MAKDDHVGCGAITAFIGLLIWGGWWLYTNYARCDEHVLRRSCAKRALELACGNSQEVIEIIDIVDKDMPAATRLVLYEFKYRPEPGKVTTAAIMRASAMFLYDKGSWETSCP